jgi:sugar phosphate isomerase/epimerase
MRLGTTSYILPADILPNVEYLAARVDDIELVLFEVEDGGGNLPDAPTVARLAELAAAHDLTYTVHLPLDLRLAANDAETSASLDKARRVFEVMGPLAPFAYVAHVEGEELRGTPGAATVAAWQARAVRSLEIACDALDQPELLCIENLETWDAVHLAPLLAALPVSRCIDVGHFWAQGVDPVPHLRQWLPRARVVHLHGVADRDHRSLAVTPRAQLAAVARELEGFAGVVTLEVFGQDDFDSSWVAWHAASR